MINFKRPMLAASLLKPTDKHDDATILAAMEKLRYPVLATLKKDGIRAIKLDDLYSRTLKLIPNKSIRARAMKLPAGFDMELFNPDLQYDEIESIVMSREHVDSDKIQFHILDQFSELKFVGYEQRYSTISLHMKWHDKERREYKPNDIVFGMPVLCGRPQYLLEYFKYCEQEQGEGICFRTPNSPYKQGRSTLKEQYLVKLTRMLQSEAIIIGMEEAMENINPRQYNAIGAMDRSSCKHNLVGKGVMGALIVRDIKTNQEFKIGTGFDDIHRRDFWLHKDCYINSNRAILYKHKPHGQKLLPRCPSFKGFRNETDIIKS